MKVHISQNLPLRKRSAALFVALALPVAAAACTRHELVAPARAEVLQERQPALRWDGGAQDRYRVQVIALLPEARIVAAHDLEVVGNSFRLPAPLPVERAAVKVLVSRDCPALEAQDVHALGAWFFVDVRAACALPPGGAAYAGSVLSWRPVAGADGYKVRVFEGDAAPGAAAAPREEVLVQAPTLRLSPQQRGGKGYAVATIQPVCGGLPGRPVAVRLAD